MGEVSLSGTAYSRQLEISIKEKPDLNWNQFRLTGRDQAIVSKFPWKKAQTRYTGKLFRENAVMAEVDRSRQVSPGPVVRAESCLIARVRTSLG